MRKLLMPEEDLGNGYTHVPSSDHCTLDGRLHVPMATYEHMFPHQREGVAWLWSLHKSDAGGILGDDMVRFNMHVVMYIRLPSF